MGYVYRHIRTDTGIPFYIGIGIDCKGKHERAVSHHGRNKHWKNIVEKSKYEIEIIFESDDYELIKSKEIEFISLYGRLDLKTGILCNMTDGGDGNLNYICSEETREKLRILNKGEKNPMWGKKISDEQKAIISKMFKGKKRPEYTGEKNPNFGKKNPEHSLRLKGRKYPERSEGFKGEKNPNFGKKHSPEIRLIISQKLKGKLAGEKNPMWGKKRPEVGLMSKELHGKKVLNTLTEIVYTSIAEAAKQEGFGLTYLKTRLSGKVKNNTSLILFKNEN